MTMANRWRPPVPAFLVASLAASILVFAPLNQSPAPSSSPSSNKLEPLRVRSGRRALSLPDPKVVSPRVQRPLQPGVSGRRAEVVLTSWYTYANDPQRKGVRVSSASIEYIYNLYISATHLGINLVVFHDSLTPQFVERYTNEYVTFQRVVPDVEDSINDFRFTPYLEYVKEHDPESVLMVDASDVHFNSNPFDYFRAHEDEYNLFVSLDEGAFYPPAWNVNECYGPTPDWDPKTPYHNAGVWGGRGDALRCSLQCVVNQLTGPLWNRGRNFNCNMPAVSYCITPTISPCGGDIIALDPNPRFVNPWKGPKEDCLGDEYAVVHNKCMSTSCVKRRDKKCPDAKLCVAVMDNKLVKGMIRGDCVSGEDAVRQ